MDSNLNKAIEILKKNNQEHIIPFLEQGKNIKLIEQILNIDFKELKDLYNKAKNHINVELDEIKPVVALNPNKLSQNKIKEIENIGINIIKRSKYAVTTMAGGQGTRLRA